MWALLWRFFYLLGLDKFGLGLRFLLRLRLLTRIVVLRLASIWALTGFGALISMALRRSKSEYFSWNVIFLLDVLPTCFEFWVDSYLILWVFVLAFQTFLVVCVVWAHFDGIYGGNLEEVTLLASVGGHLRGLFFEELVQSLALFILNVTLLNNNFLHWFGHIINTDAYFLLHCIILVLFCQFLKAIARSFLTDMRSSGLFVVFFSIDLQKLQEKCIIWRQISQCEDECHKMIHLSLHAFLLGI